MLGARRGPICGAVVCWALWRFGLPFCWAGGARLLGGLYGTHAGFLIGFPVCRLFGRVFVMERITAAGCLGCGYCGCHGRRLLRVAVCLWDHGMSGRFGPPLGRGRRCGDRPLFRAIDQGSGWPGTDHSSALYRANGPISVIISRALVQGVYTDPRTSCMDGV